MKSGLKTALSLLLTFIAFTVIAIASLSGLFSPIEKRFYEPAQVQQFRSELNEVASAGNQYFSSLLAAFGSDNGGFLNDESVLTFLSVSPSDEVLHRLAVLSEAHRGLEGIRVVDASGRRVHFSSFRNDYRLDAERRIYSNYQELKTLFGTPEIPFENLSCFSGEETHPYRIGIDGQNQRIVYSFPLENNGSRFCVLFYVGTRGFINTLIEKKIISVNQDIPLVSSADCMTGGFILGLENDIRGAADAELLKIWKNGQVDTDGIQTDGIQFVFDDRTVNYTVFTNRSTSAPFFSILFSSDSVLLPGYVKILILVSAFISVCLFFLILFNFKKDDDVIIRDRIKRVQFELLSEYFDKNLERAEIAGIIEAKKSDVSVRIKKSLGRRGKRHSAELDTILEKSWSEIIDMLSAEKKQQPSFDMSEIRRMLEELLSATPVTVRNQFVQTVPAKVAEPEPVEDLEDVDAVEPAEDLEEADVVEPADGLEEADGVEPVDGLEEADVVEPVDDLEATGGVEPVDDLEEVDAVESVEDLEEADGEESVEDLEEADGVEPVDGLEEVDGAEPVDDLEEADSVEPVEDLEEADGVEPADGLEEADGVEPVDDLEEADGVEPADGLEEADGAEPVEDLEEADGVEPVDDLEEADGVEPVDGLEEVDAVEPVEDLEEADGEESVEDLEEADVVEPADDLEEADGVEPVDDLEEVDAVEPVEDLEEADGIESVDGLEEADSVEPAEDLEEADGAEPVEDLEEADGEESVDGLEEADGVEPADGLEEADGAEPVEDLEEADGVEPVEDLEEADGAEPVEDLEDTDGVEPVDDLEEADGAEPVEDLEEADGVEPVEDLEEADGAEPVEDLEDTDGVEPVDDLEEADGAEPVEDLEEADGEESVEDLEEADGVEPADDLEATGGVKSVEVSEDEIDETSESFGTAIFGKTDDLFEFASSPFFDADEKLNAIKSVLTNDNFEEGQKTLENVNAMNTAQKYGIIDSEPLEFSDPAVEQESNPDMSLADGFEIFYPGDELFSASSLGNSENTSVPAPEENKVTLQEDDVSDLEFLSEGETRPFMMTAFGANNNHVTDLSYEAIVEGDDGVYQIAENLDTDGVPIDNDFQNLVNSVLK
ncbi:midas domain-containing protein [Treponema porcinum]|uniref:Uncharacterized protein n=1 Tax=Treponema porcinum TaxID=261392 RepID=A0A1T4JLK6_TREPO|nr:DUF4573 domain-containing protein [Treponema porcinum]SJZ31090.1 hypothetical protein SAMN02745149_00577 [Treponema porcinum]